jgi:prolyl-tRNA editing enzyme YbaK/EbsC (Cys-tRNA(Pro) deacylase)
MEGTARLCPFFLLFARTKGKLMLSASAQRVQDVLDSFGITLQVVELPASTRSAVEAAQAVGCQVEQIAKSLVFKAQDSDRPVLVIASGPNRVNEGRLGEWLGEAAGKADADFVRKHTGFVIGGVPPVGHIERLLTYVDEDLLQYDTIWAAAGTPHAVFQLKPDDLVRITSGIVVCVK